MILVEQAAEAAAVDLEGQQHGAHIHVPACLQPNERYSSHRVAPSLGISFYKRPSGLSLTPRPAMPSFLGMDLRGHLDLLLLGTLRQTGPAHGYALIAALRERSENAFDLPEGTVYPALHRLERDGLVTSEWDSAAPRRRRVYRLTPAGRAALAEKRREWRAFARGVQAIVGGDVAKGWT